MRCDCCNKQLNDEEATAKFAESLTYVNMCKGCRSTLPKDLKIIIRHDLSKNKEESEEELSDKFDLGEYGDEEENWS